MVSEVCLEFDNGADTSQYLVLKFLLIMEYVCPVGKLGFGGFSKENGFSGSTFIATIPTNVLFLLSWLKCNRRVAFAISFAFEAIAFICA
eukprot:CAMPEP_0173064950 /NCGR_PEP_ID=MMETSP1102-20130122/5313_1 /TAXON_ID=49646 /ORGANISM="Geminigera sp., Strain Caron Lab Isolate" /LENGTH=89 /DNA_ID=CAMNT_0013932099 /DNA_START=474 /DNA_END=743 /DNA_ORIENTATION=+